MHCRKFIVGNKSYISISHFTHGRRRANRILAFLILTLLIAGAFNNLLGNPPLIQNASASLSPPSDWQYVRQLNISDAGGNSTDYQKKLRLYANDNTKDDPANGTIDLVGYCSDFPNDIRFGTTNDPSTATQLPQWIEQTNIQANTLTEYSGNPVFSGGTGQSYARFGTVWKDDSTYYLFYEYNNTIYYVTSSDGKSWGTSATLCIEPSSSGWDSSIVTVPIVWKEGSRWYMLYRGDDGTTKQIGLVWSDDLSSWTKSPNNPVLQPSSSGWDSSHVEQNNIIKVGNTYYLWYNNWHYSPAPGYRYSGLATTTSSPENWSNSNFTKDSNNPIITDGVNDNSFCGTIFKYGSYYYQIEAAQDDTNRILLAEMWRSPNPTFYDNEREYMGVIFNAPSTSSNWEYWSPDVIGIVSDDITRSTFNATGGELWFYYTGCDSGGWSNSQMGLFEITNPSNWLSGSNYADIWVKLPSDGSDTIYLFAGNSGASEYSNGGATFQFFDNFSSSIDWTNKWSSTSQSNYSVSDGKLVLTKPSSSGGIIHTKNKYQDVIFEALIRNGDSDGDLYFSPTPTAGTYDGSEEIVIDHTGTSHTRVRINSVNSDVDITEDTSKYWKVSYRSPSSGNAKGIVYNSDDSIQNSKEAIPVYRDVYMGLLHWIGAGSSYVDWIFIRKYADPEPEWDSYGSWTSLTTNSAPTQSNQLIWDGSTEKTLNATDVTVSPTSFNITISDPDGDKMNITIKTNESGTWKVVNQTSGSGLSNGTYSFTNVSWVDSYSTTYYISFNVTDGTDWTNETFKFTTIAGANVVCSSSIYNSAGNTVSYNWGNWTATGGDTNVGNYSDANQTYIKATNDGGADGTATIDWTAGYLANGSNQIAINNNIKYVYGTGATPSAVSSWTFSTVDDFSFQVTIPASSTFWMYYEIQSVGAVPSGAYTQTFTWTAT